MPEIGDRIADSVIRFFGDEDNIQLIDKLKAAGLQFIVNEEALTLDSNLLENTSFVISGVFEHYSRNEIKNTIKKNGGKLISAISKKVDYLVAGDKMGPSKLAKAEKLGVNIISENDFIAMINKA